MNGCHDQREAARKDADLMVTQLMSVSGVLEEVATVWRRAELSGQKLPSDFPGELQQAAGRLADTLHALPDAGSDEHQALAFSAVAQLATLENRVQAAAVTGDLCDAGMWATIQGSLDQVGQQLWCLISHLVKIQGTRLATGASSGRRSQN
jgi:hypothetical protein